MDILKVTARDLHGLGSGNSENFKMNAVTVKFFDSEPSPQFKILDP